MFLPAFPHWLYWVWSYTQAGNWHRVHDLGLPEVALSFFHINFKKFLGVFKTRFTFMLMSVLPAYVEVHSICAVTIRTAVMDGYCKLNPGPLREQPGLSIAESSL